MGVSINKGKLSVQDKVSFCYKSYVKWEFSESITGLVYLVSSRFLLYRLPERDKHKLFRERPRYNIIRIDITTGLVDRYINIKRFVFIRSVNAHLI